MRAVAAIMLVGMSVGCDWTNSSSIPDSAIPVSQQPTLEKWVPAAPEQDRAGKFTELSRILEAEQSELKRLKKEKLERLSEQSAEQTKVKNEQVAFEKQWARLKTLPGFSEKDLSYYESVLARREERSKAFSAKEAAFRVEIDSRITAQEIRVEAARAAVEAAEKLSLEEAGR